MGELVVIDHIPAFMSHIVEATSINMIYSVVTSLGILQGLLLCLILYKDKTKQNKQRKIQNLPY